MCGLSNACLPRNGLSVTVYNADDRSVKEIGSARKREDECKLTVLFPSRVPSQYERVAVRSRATPACLRGTILASKGR